MSSSEEKQAERLITTEVLADVKPDEWYKIALLVPHEPIRMSLADGEKYLAHLDGTVAWKVDNFFGWWKGLASMIHHHHDIEEEIYFPWLKTRATVPDKMADDHATLLKMLENISGHEKQFADADSDDKRKAVAESLRDTFCKMRKSMRAHLKEEEEVCPKILKENFSPAEEGAIVGKILQDLGPEGTAQMLPWIISSMSRWGGDEFVTGFKKNVPPPVVNLHDAVWKDMHQAGFQKLIESLASDDKYVPPKPKAAGPPPAAAEE